MPKMGGKRHKKKEARRRNNEKTTPTVASVKRGKRPPDVDKSSYFDCHPTWTARDIDVDGFERSSVGWNLTPKAAGEILAFLERLSERTWGEWCSDQNMHHHQSVDSLDRPYRERIQEKEDCEKVFRFRLSGKSRLWGFRSGHEFRVLWFDPDHEVYPVKKKHT